MRLGGNIILNYMNYNKNKMNNFDLKKYIAEGKLLKEEEVTENRFLEASMEDLEQVIRNLAHTGEMSEDEALELAIKKLESMLDGRDDLDEGKLTEDDNFEKNERLIQFIKDVNSLRSTYIDDIIDSNEILDSIDTLNNLIQKEIN
jgi:hypothetical protein